jgi:predicted aconitase
MTHAPHPSTPRRRAFCGAAILIPAMATMHIEDVDCEECLAELDRTPTDQEIADAAEERELARLRPNQQEEWTP